MCFDGDACTVWVETRRRARKQYACLECGSTIPNGARYVNIRSYLDSWETMRIHVECMALWRLVRENLCGGGGLILIGGLDEELGNYELNDLGVSSKQASAWRRYKRRFSQIREKYGTPGKFTASTEGGEQ